jgi:putative transposase
MSVENRIQIRSASHRDAMSVEKSKMPNTYTQIHIHAVFTVQNRASVICKAWQEDLYRYITGIIQNHGHKLLAINGMPDHVHILFGMRPMQALSDLMQAVKGDSSRWVNEKRLVMGRFSWQEGYGAFSYGKSQVPAVIRYIQNQERHHCNQTFIEEYHEFLRKFEVAFEDPYLFTPVVYDDKNVE